MTTIVVNVLIISIVSLVIGSLNKKVDIAKKKVEGGEELDPLTDGIFSIEYGIGLKIFSIVNVIFFSVILLLSSGDYFFGWSIGENSSPGVIVFFVLYDLFSIYMLLGICIWKIDVNKYEIVYRNLFGVKKIYDFRMIEVHKSPKGTIYVYSDGKKRIRIDDNLEGGIYFMYWAKQYKVYRT